MADRLYYDRTQGAPPWPELLKALELLGRTDGLAIDLGCGAGRDSLELLRRGWQVLAVDKAAEALERLQAQLDPAWAPRLQTRCEPFEHTELPAADLVNSAFALPFCAPAQFPACGTASSGHWPVAGCSAATCWASATTGPAPRSAPSPTRSWTPCWPAGRCCT